MLVSYEKIIVLYLHSFCAVKYAEDQIYVIGGYGQGDKEGWIGDVDKVFIFNPMNDFTYIEGPSLIIRRSKHACGLMSDFLQTQIVVTGGIPEAPNLLSSVEIFDPTLNNWITGKKMKFTR